MSRVLGNMMGGAGHILSEKTLSQNKGEVVDFTTIEHFIAKIAKAGPCWGLTVSPPKTCSFSRSIVLSLHQASKNERSNKKTLFRPLNLHAKTSNHARFYV